MIGLKNTQSMSIMDERNTNRDSSPGKAKFVNIKKYRLGKSLEF